MLRRLDMFKWLLMAWLMLWGSVCVWAYTPTSQAVPYSSYPQLAPASQTSQMASRPTYQFRSTSAFAPSMGTTATFTPLADNPEANPANRGHLRKTEGWGWGNTDPEDDPMGEVPVGDVAWIAIILCAALYLAFRRRKA